MSGAAERGVGGAYVRHPVTGKIYAEGSAEAEKILAGELHPTHARAAISATKTTPKPRRKPQRKPKRSHPS